VKRASELNRCIFDCTLYTLQTFIKLNIVQSNVLSTVTGESISEKTCYFHRTISSLVFAEGKFGILGDGPCCLWAQRLLIS